MSDDIIYMRRCLQLAASGSGLVSPNPLVGCVIVNEEGKILSEGFHHQYGGPHAEVIAIEGLQYEGDMSKLTLYVNLEPCSHFGKTPPCANLIVEKGFQKVVMATLDPNPAVQGKGAKRLKEQGIEIRIGILADEAEYLNRHFFTFHREKRPFFTLKWAQSLNGYMGKTDYGSESRQISGKRAQQVGHQLRANHDAILVGRRTVENDNPLLNTREYPGKSPQIILLDPDLRISPHSKLFGSPVRIHISNKSKEGIFGNVSYFIMDKENWPIQLSDYLYLNKIQSVLVEGGANTLQGFLSSGLWDECVVFQSPEFKNWDIKAPEWPTGKFETKACGSDQHITISPI